MKVFVEKLPTNCSCCDACHTRPYDRRYKVDGEKFCGIENCDVGDYYNYGIPVWCPLKCLPEKRKELSIEEYEFGRLGLVFATGWNACLKEILSK